MGEAAAYGEPALEQVPGWTCGPMEAEAHAGADLLAGPVDHGEHTMEPYVPEGLHLVGETHAGAVEECEEESAAEMKHYELTTTPTTFSPMLLEGKR